MSNLFGCILLALSFLAGSLQAQTPSILGISQKHLSGEQGDMILLTVTASGETESLSIDEATFTANNGSTGNLAKPVLTDLKPISGSTSKQSEITISFGTNKTILPDYKVAALKIVPVRSGGNGHPYIFNISPPLNRYVEIVSVSIPFEVFSRIANSKSVEIRVGALELALRDFQLEAIRLFLKKVKGAIENNDHIPN